MQLCIKAHYTVLITKHKLNITRARIVYRTVLVLVNVISLFVFAYFILCMITYYIRHTA